MSTTTIRLPDDLKARVTAVAEQAGVSPHSFILQAIAEKTATEEMRNDFHQEADKRYAKLLASGQTIPWADMRVYLEARAAGQNDAPIPHAKSEL
jgi:predicted transcriptional regulator